MSQSAQSPSPTASRELGGGSLPKLFERYQILGIIGQGGMGTVFRGFHLNLKRHVAIKTLRVDKLNTPNLVKRFRQEMEIIGQMDHANVVRASDAGEKNGVFYLVMEFLTGADLATLVARRGRLDVPDACELMRQAALGLDYIHQTLVHRDIKPSNLMLTTTGLVKILDLGLARGGDPIDREKTPEGCPVGTFAFMAPEQAGAGQTVDGRADIYSLGCTLFKLLTGAAPFSAREYDNAAGQIFAHCHVPLSSVASVKLIPDDLRPIVLKMTAKAPEERYQSAREVAEILAPFAAGSAPKRLLDDLAPDEQPLVQPLPEELERLTKVAGETPTREAVTTYTPRPGSARKVAAWLAAGAAIALGVAAWFYVPNLFQQPSAGPSPGVKPSPAGPVLRDLDGLKIQTLIPLFDQQPVPIGCDVNDPLKWRWDPDQKFVDAKGGYVMLFQLGTTSRSSFGFETAIKQHPWTGEVGIFWGYREDAALKAAKTPKQTFAWFQVLFLRKERDGKEDRLFVVRGRVGLHYYRGQIVTDIRRLEQHEVKGLRGDEAILRIEVEGNRLNFAGLGVDVLTALFSDKTNGLFLDDAYQGPLGLVTFSHAATFRMAHVTIRSSD